MLRKILIVLLAVFFPLIMINAEDQYGMKPYPAADEGFTRQVFRVPALENEADRLVEIVVGKTLLVDCNPTRFMGSLESKVAEGWGFPYYVLKEVSGPASTLMACSPDAVKTEEFVWVRGDGFMQRYNSKLPVVTYVPEGFEVRYRIWTAGSELGKAAVE
ncbi:MAG: serine protease inhibitor ecotin [Candidatus Competibacteraceae bacterium]|jgi:ecotin|nr:serine protease inhibitor ecotin [Candidatus Competibacteraceae bacterium]